LRSNCGLRATWQREARRRCVRWRRFLRQKRLGEGDLLQRRALKPRRQRSARSPARKNWRRKGGVQDGRVTSCHLPIRAEERSNGRVRVGKFDEELIRKERHAFA
jgi:hypothetical protein